MPSDFHTYACYWLCCNFLIAIAPTDEKKQQGKDFCNVFIHCFCCFFTTRGDQEWSIFCYYSPNLSLLFSRLKCFSVCRRDLISCFTSDLTVTSFQLLQVTLQELIKTSWFSFHNSLATPETWLQWLTSAMILHNKVFIFVFFASKESKIISVQENVSIFAKKHEHLLSKSQVPYAYLHHKSKGKL